MGSAHCIEWDEDTETTEKSHSNLAVNRRPQKTSHETRFVLGDRSRNILNAKGFIWWRTRAGTR